MKKPRPWTVIIRRSIQEYVAVCLELNVSARGDDIPDVQRNLQNAIDDYLAYVEGEADAEVLPIPTGELIEFLADLQPAFAQPRKRKRPRMLPLELNEVLLYV